MHNTDYKPCPSARQRAFFFQSSCKERRAFRVRNLRSPCMVTRENFLFPAKTHPAAVSPIRYRVTDWQNFYFIFVKQKKKSADPIPLFIAPFTLCAPTPCSNRFHLHPTTLSGGARGSATDSRFCLDCNHPPPPSWSGARGWKRVVGEGRVPPRGSSRGGREFARALNARDSSVRVSSYTPSPRPPPPPVVSTSPARRCAYIPCVTGLHCSMPRNHVPTPRPAFIFVMTSGRYNENKSRSRVRKLISI